MSLYTFEYQTDGSRTEMLAKLHPFRTINHIHEQPMTCVALSHFTPPPDAAPARTPYLRLASVSVKNTVVVQYIPLRKLPTSSSSSSPSSSSSQHYVVALKSRAPSGTYFALFTFVVFVVSSLLAYGILEVMGITQPLLGARDVVPVGWLAPLPGRYDAVYDHLEDEPDSSAFPVVPQAVVGGSDVPDVPDAADFETDFGAVEIHPVAAFFSSMAEPAEPDTETSADVAQQVLFLRGEDADHTIEIAPHDETAHGPAVPWDKLDEAQQATWRHKLEQAGHWTEDMGETVFRGVLFGELAGIVGALMR